MRIADRPIRESSNHRAWLDFKGAAGNHIIAIVMTGAAVMTTIFTGLTVPSEWWNGKARLVLIPASGFGTFVSISILIYVLIWIRTPYRQRDEARMGAEIRATRLQVAKRILYEVATEGQKMIAGYELDSALEPTQEHRERWFAEGCRVLGKILNPYEAEQQRNRRMLNEGQSLQYGNWATVLHGLAGYLAARAGQIDETDLLPDFRPEEWADYESSSGQK